MACEICGRTSCTRSFHSLEEQERFDTIADPVKERMRRSLIYDISRLETTADDDNDEYVLLSDVIEIIENY